MSVFPRLVLAVLFLALASRIAIPVPTALTAVSPVPLTLQSLAVLLTGAALGPRLGAAAVALWLLLAAAGLPLLSGGSAGLGGPTTGYLLAMPFAAALAGARPDLRFMLAAHALILITGTAWLAALIGLPKALSAGLWPFLPGALLKSLAAAAIAPRLRAPASSANKSP